MQHGATPSSEPAQTQTLSKVKDGLTQLHAAITADPTLTDDQKKTYTKHIESLMSLG
jgi:hypothetical protein